MKKILVVDNDEMILGFMEEVLKEAGHEIITARSGLAAVDILSEFVPDIVFLDLVMPNINGEKLCKLIRKMHGSKHPFLVILSAVAAEERPNVSALGADACIAKGPLSEMREYIFQVIEQSEKASARSSLLEPMGIESLSPRGITKELLSIKNCFEAILERMSEGIFEINTDARILYANPVGIKLCGIAEERLLGCEFAGIFSEVDRGRVERILLNPGDYPHNIGEENPLTLNTYLVTMKVFQVPAYTGMTMIMLEDVTERKSNEQALRESEERFRSMVNLTSDGILLVGGQGEVRFANPASERILGEKRDELLENKLDLRSMCNKTTEVDFTRKDGGRAVVEISVVEVEWENETCYLISVRDIKGRREMEEELLRVRKLESLGILAGGLAHDFNNHLTGILGNIELVEVEDQSGKEELRLTRAKEEIFRARDLMKQLVTLAEAETLSKEVLPLGDLIREWVTEALSGLDVTCHFSIEEGLWEAEVDERHIKRAVSNVVLNGAEATPEGGTVKISAVNLPLAEGPPERSLPLESDHYVRITVEDEGAGILEEELPSIFDPYFSTKKRGTKKGVGLGLTTAYYAVRNHGGYIDVQSRKNVGTKFNIYLPAIGPEN